MSEQSNPIAEDQENQESEVAQTQATPAAEQPAAATTQKTPSVSLKDRDFESSDEDEDDYDEEDEFEEDEEEDLHVEGPAEYVQRERSGRGRRIGSDVRPDDVDYKNIPVLSRFLDRRGRILSRRKTRVSAKVQRRIVVAIKRARHLALLPYTAEQTRIVRKRR